jgi:serine/threonine protein kinase
MTYMAPEIKEGKVYKGTQVDLFSIGVILFIIVQGIFPFKEARREEYFYNLLLTGDFQTYFTKVNGHGLSDEFKQLVLSLFSYDPSARPTLQEVKAHPWMNQPFDFEATRADILAKLAQKQAAAAQAVDMPQRPVKVRRGATMH